MTRTIIVVIALIAMVAVVNSCKKKNKSGIGCYICQFYRSSNSSNPNKISPNTLIAYDTLCNQNPGTMNFYVMSHNTFDTLYYNADSFFIFHNTVTCDVE